MTKNSTTGHARRGAMRELLLRMRSLHARSLCILLLAATILLSSCSSNHSSTAQQSATFTGNWQFSIVNTPDLTASSGLQGGFLLQSSSSVTGTVVFANTLLNSSQGPCNSGAAPITGTVSGQNTITLTAIAGTQTYTLTGSLSADGSTMTGTYTATAGTYTAIVNGVPQVEPCGNGTQTGTQTWSATLIPPLSGSITGTFHSSNLSTSGLANQDFPVTGSLLQGQNIGGSSATVTGTLNFSGYPCASTVSVNGQISGNTVVLQLIAPNGANVGQIGVPASEASSSSQDAQPVTLNSTANGYVLSSAGTAYVVNSPSCFDASANNAEDVGYICLALNSTTACQQPITISPARLTFPPQLLASPPSIQTITLTNNQPSAALTGLSLSWFAISGSNSDTGQTDFTNAPNFTESDNCAVPAGSPFNLLAGQSCTITISFAPQESCTWLPDQGGTLPPQCPLLLTALLSIANVPSVDQDQNFTIPVTGTGVSFVEPSTPQLAFSAEAFGESSPSQTLYFTNDGVTPVQILPAAACVNSTLNQYHTLPHPLVQGSTVAGVQVVSNIRQDTNNSTIDYSCDDDPNTQRPNFQISADTCSGTLLQPQAQCSLQIAFAPQSATTYFSALQYFLELNTVQCTDPVNDPPSPSNPCEIDGGRFPVELTANLASPLRMTPAAGLNFGGVSVGTLSNPQTITLTNDPNLSAQQTVTFVGKIVVSGSYSESDNCPYSLAPGTNCTITVYFKPSVVGNNLGALTINYTTGTNSGLQTQPVYLLGTGQ
jgi:hypothetical protein